MARRLRGGPSATPSLTEAGRIASRRFVLLATIGLSLAACAPQPPARDAFDGPPVRTQTTDEGIVVEVHREGEGRAAQDGDRVELHYRLELENGAEVDASRTGKPLSFLVGGREVIEGMHPAVRGMKPGERRSVTIPPKYGYGGRAMGLIPADATLTFHIEMIAVHPGS